VSVTVNITADKTCEAVMRFKNNLRELYLVKGEKQKLLF